jgi:hypothetical protein
MIRRVLVAAALAACGRQDAPPKVEPKAAPMREQKKLDTLHMTVPDGWTSNYDSDGDKWLFESPKLADGRTTYARIERAPLNAVASPDAYLAQLFKHWDAGTTATFEKRATVKDGFAMTLVVKPAVDPDHPKRETYVIRELGSVWYQCLSEWIPDDATRDQLLALCKSLAL